MEMRRKKRRIYVGCEGEAEYEYVRWLKLLIQTAKISICLHADNLGGGGLGKMARVAVMNIKRMNKDEKFIRHFMFLDTDRAQQHPAELEELNTVLSPHHVTVVWQDPCGEAFLLLHAWILEPRRRKRIMNAAHARREYRNYFDTDHLLDLSRLERAFPRDISSLRELEPMPQNMAAFLDALGI